jgi:hypothetical protein
VEQVYQGKASKYLPQVSVRNPSMHYRICYSSECYASHANAWQHPEPSSNEDAYDGTDAEKEDSPVQTGECEDGLHEGRLGEQVPKKKPHRDEAVGLFSIKTEIESSDFDFYVHATGQFQLHQSIYCFRRSREDVYEALVGAKLELLPALLIHVGRAQHGELLFLGRQRNRAANDGTGGLHSFHDFLGRFVYEVVVVGLQLNANFLIHYVFGPIDQLVTGVIYLLWF